MFTRGLSYHGCFQAIHSKELTDFHAASNLMNGHPESIQKLIQYQTTGSALNRPTVLGQSERKFRWESLVHFGLNNSHTSTHT